MQVILARACFERAIKRCLARQEHVATVTSLVCGRHHPLFSELADRGHRNSPHAMSKLSFLRDEDANFSEWRRLLRGTRT
jgi:hypothetical protein